MIRPEYRKLYGPDWRAYRLALIRAHGPYCMNCRREIRRYLNGAHETHDPRRSSVKLWCASCHARHDARHRIAVRRRNRARLYGQLWLWPELAWDAWLVPRRVIDAAARAAQERLF